MARTREDYEQEGYNAASHPLHRDRALTLEPGDMPLFGSGSSWQALAFAKGWRKAVTERMAVKVHREVQEGKHAGAHLHTTNTCTLVNPAERRRDSQIDEMVEGYITAMLWSTSDTVDGEDVETLEGFDVSDEARAKALDTCTRFYDAHRTDLAAYADLRTPVSGHTPYECAGHDLWLTTAGHGVGFWDRGMGRVGKRLSAQCGFRKPFPSLEAYVGDDMLVYVS